MEQGVDYNRCLDFVREARAQGLKTPVILMGKSSLRLVHSFCLEILQALTVKSIVAQTGYFNPLLAHGEERAVQDAKEAGANGFIIVDLPPEEAVGFRQICTREG